MAIEYEAIVDFPFIRFRFVTWASPETVYDLFVDVSQHHRWEERLLEVQPHPEPSVLTGVVYAKRYGESRQDWHRIFGSQANGRLEFTTLRRPSLIEWKDWIEDSEGDWHSSEHGLEIESASWGTVVTYRWKLSGRWSEKLLGKSFRQMPEKNPAKAEYVHAGILTSVVGAGLNRWVANLKAVLGEEASGFAHDHGASAGRTRQLHSQAQRRDVVRS